MSGFAPWTRLLLAALCLLLLGMDGHSYRYSRTVMAPSGWAVLELPDDVLAAARPGTPDLRLVTHGSEFAYAFEDRLLARAPSLPFINVTRVPGRETTALIDRGEHRDLVDSIEIVVGGAAPFLKPLIIEASEDRISFREMARASIFRVSPAEMRRVSFAPSDSRYLRIRLDDRESAPVGPVSGWLSPVAPSAPAERALGVTLARKAGTASEEVFVVELPSKNLPAASLELAIVDPVFSRRVCVYEALVFRDRLSRRLVGEGRVERSVTGSELLQIPLSELTSSRLEIEIEHHGPALSLERGTLWMRRKRLVFRVPERSGPLALEYGSLSAEAAAYDLGQALASGLPRELAAATLGPVTDRGERSPLPKVLRGPPIERKGFARQRRITLPKRGGLAYLDLVGVPVAQASKVRIVDVSGRQVPFVVESEPQPVSLPLTLTAPSAVRVSTTHATGFDPKESLQSLTLRALSPAYFRREVSIYETTRDARGPTGKRWLGGATWEQRPDAPSAATSVRIAQPSGRELLIEIEQGDNPPLVLAGATVALWRARIDFLFESGEQLFLLSDNPKARAAAYDLALIRDALVRSAAQPAALVDVPVAPVSLGKGLTRPWWFWFAVVAAFSLVVAVLLRVLRGS